MYPQCSDQSSEKTASSKWFGSRSSSVDDTVELLVREAELAMESAFPRRSSGGQSTGRVGGRPDAAGRQRGVDRVPRVRSRDVSRRDALLLLLLSAIWGSSFMFIRLGVDELEPSVVVLGRTVVGALVLLPLVIGRGGLRPIRHALVPLVVLGALNNALPFWLLGFAETHLDSGLTAVIQAAAPIFTVLLAVRMDATQRVTGSRLVGSAIGFLGVALLVGAQTGGDLLGALAVIGTAFCYAASVLYAGRTVRSFPPLQVSIGQLAAGALVVAPFALAQLPDEAPPAGTIAAVVTLGVLGSGIAYLLYFAPHRQRRRLPRDPGHVPRAGLRARLRRRLPRRGGDGHGARGPGADPGRHRTRDRARPPGGAATGVGASLSR